MKQIETSKGKFIVKDIPSLDLVYDDKLNDYLLSLKRIKLSKITEEEASEIVDNSMMNTLCYENYINEGFKGRTWFNSAIQSLHSLLESQGIEITNNTYIFKVN